MPRLIVKENYYEGPCGHAPDPEKISKVSEHFCKAMSGDKKFRKRCMGCSSPYRLCYNCGRAGRLRLVAQHLSGLQITLVEALQQGKITLGDLVRRGRIKRGPGTLRQRVERAGITWPEGVPDDASDQDDDF